MRIFNFNRRGRILPLLPRGFHGKSRSRASILGASLLAGAVIALLPVLGSQTVLAAKDDPIAREIMQKVKDRDDGDNMISELEMVLIDKKKNKRIRKIKSFRKDKGKDNLTLMFFLSPADVKDTGFLTYDYDEPGKDDDQWLYLPALRKTKRIASSDKSGAFMGSDFNFSDMTEADLNDYDYTLMKEVKIKGVPTWQIQTVPRSKEISDETGYSKSVIWVRKDNYVMIRGVLWVYKSRRRKYFQVKKLENIEGIWVATEMQMATKEGKKTVHSTKLRFDKIKFNQPLKPSLFTVRQLEKGL